MKFVGLYSAIRIFKNKTATALIDFDAFKEIVESPFVAGRIGEYCEKTYIPTKEEVEAASKMVHADTTN